MQALHFYKNVSSEQVDVRQYNENLMQSQEIGGVLPKKIEEGPSLHFSAIWYSVKQSSFYIHYTVV